MLPRLSHPELLHRAGGIDGAQSGVTEALLVFGYRHCRGRVRRGSTRKLYNRRKWSPTLATDEEQIRHLPLKPDQLMGPHRQIPGGYRFHCFKPNKCAEICSQGDSVTRSHCDDLAVLSNMFYASVFLSNMFYASYLLVSGFSVGSSMLIARYRVGRIYISFVL